MKSLLFFFLFLFSSFSLFSQGLQKDISELSFLLGKYMVSVYRPAAEGTWQKVGAGRTTFEPILDGRFIRETSVTKGENGPMTMESTIGYDLRYKKLRLFAIDKEFGVMDAYIGFMKDDYLIFTNINADIPFVAENGDKMSFRMSFHKLEQGNLEFIVEWTKDGGVTWFPFTRHMYTKRE